MPYVFTFLDVELNSTTYCNISYIHLQSPVSFKYLLLLYGCYFILLKENAKHLPEEYIYCRRIQEMYFGALPSKLQARQTRLLTIHIRWICLFSSRSQFSLDDSLWCLFILGNYMPWRQVVIDSYVVLRRVVAPYFTRVLSIAYAAERTGLVSVIGPHKPLPQI